MGPMNSLSLIVSPTWSTHRYKGICAKNDFSEKVFKIQASAFLNESYLKYVQHEHCSNLIHLC